MAIRNQKAKKRVDFKAEFVQFGPVWWGMAFFEKKRKKRLSQLLQFDKVRLAHGNI
jgi:hypothetical protein